MFTFVLQDFVSPRKSPRKSAASPGKAAPSPQKAMPSPRKSPRKRLHSPTLVSISCEWVL